MNDDTTQVEETTEVTETPAEEVVVAETPATEEPVAEASTETPEAAATE